MKRSDLTERLLDIKREKGWSWKHICENIGGYSEVLIVGAILGQMKLTKPQAANAGELFGLSKSETAMLNEVPMRGEGTPMPPTDPLIYRFYELVMVNGPAWKALIEEEYGDGIMSAIDFDMVMERLPNPKGDRVKITMTAPAATCRNTDSRRGDLWCHSGACEAGTRNLDMRKTSQDSGSPLRGVRNDVDLFRTSTPMTSW
jgi:cyanate lyase